MRRSIDSGSFLALVLGAVIALAGAPATAEAPPAGPQTKASWWQGTPDLAKVSGHLLRARDLARRGVGMPEIRAKLPVVLFPDDLVEVDVRIDGRLEKVGASVERQLAAAGMDVSGVFPKYRRVLGRCALERLDELAAVPGVTAVKPVYRPRTRAGSVTSQGDISINADDARLAFGVDGTGVKVGVLSDSFHSLIGGTTSATVCTSPSGDVPTQILSGSTPQSSGDLPAQVTVLDNCDAGDFCSFGQTDEGAALAEIVHDLAPGAEILFHTAFRSEADFAEGISELAACGAEVLVDDVIWPGEPMFQDGIIAQAVQAAVDGGAAYFSAAGNEAGFGVDETYVDADSETDDRALPITGADLHDFGAGDRFAAITIPPGCGVDLVLQWNQPFSDTLGPGSANDLDLYLCRTDSGAQGAGGVLLGCDLEDLVDGALAASTEVQGCDSPSGDPFEIASYFNGGGSPVSGYVAVEHYCGSESDVRFRIAVSATGPCSLAGAERLADCSAGSGGGIFCFEDGIFDHPQIYGHAAAAGAHAVAAVFYGEIDSGGAVEPPGGQIDVTPLSSLGGDLPFYFDDVGDPLPGAPVMRVKPDLAAPEGTNTSFYGVDVAYDVDSFPNMFGTSAAVPHAAAVAALMLDRYPSLTEPQIRSILGSSATDIETGGADALSGNGLVDAHQALLQTPYSLVGRSPTSLDFGSVEVGSSSTQEITVSNTGTADLHVASISSSDAAVFSPSTGGTSACASLSPTVPPAGSCTIEVTFSPSAVNHSEALTIESDSAVDRTLLIPLTGTGFRNCTTNELVVSAATIGSSDLFEACVSVTTSGVVQVDSPRSVTFRAGSRIVLENGFSVAAGATFSAANDPLLVPPP